ncbi:hypothetical protein HY412_02430 [Candidatus Kaiserbacteria bacterium]|nr:hypothetical protein [Candidatus Kaiserbacteria bacterium]
MALKANQPIRWKERIGVMAVGHTFKQIEELVFDYGLYPAVIAWWGAVTGGLVMTVFSAFICYLYILFYDWSKKDWFGLELLKRVRDGEEKSSQIARFIQRTTRKNDWAAFLVLSVYTDPFVTAMYLRHGVEKYNGLSSRDWKVFWSSVLVANLWWTVVVAFAVAGVRFIYNWLGLA